MPWAAASAAPCGSGAEPSAVAAASTKPGVSRQPVASTTSASSWMSRAVSWLPVQAIIPSETRTASASGSSVLYSTMPVYRTERDSVTRAPGSREHLGESSSIDLLGDQASSYRRDRRPRAPAQALVAGQLLEQIDDLPAVAHEVPRGKIGAVESRGEVDAAGPAVDNRGDA